MTGKSLDKTIHSIRDFINSPRKQHALLQDKAAWHQLCVSLDAIEVTRLAVNAYLRRNSPDIAEKYLSLYGVFQALFVQQDAMKNLSESLGLPYEQDSTLNKIRDIRNDSVGHPTNRIGGDRFITISGHGAASPNFSMAIYRPAGNTEFKTVDMKEIISIQNLVVQKMLGKVLDALKEEEMKHQKKFKKESLAALFPKTLNYHYQSIGAAIAPEREMPSYGAINLKVISDAINSFKKALVSGGTLKASPHLNYNFEEVEYPLAELKLFFTKPKESKLNEMDARIFLFFIPQKVQFLLNLAKELDEEYAAKA